MGITSYFEVKPKEFRLTSETVKQLKNKSARTSTLTYPDFYSTMALMVDAPNKVVVSDLNKLVENAWKPTAFSLKRLAPAEAGYSTFGQKLFAIYQTIRHFRHKLEGRNW